ncbi:DUF7507 domain-containing protein [Flavobacterium seoulense]|uniref:DUF7507 domain-containing protein n=1 Tax=Flavobacterium seoulense TaxID=1492738 RepID=A0A066WVW5_9FLAO|nr:gliding motility-associated C-terminal domain-containing protein [Flavobacterium seoulense]KDN56728.1 hypothetical protein FEM21_02310 [Flavobacterium seoulense]
MRKNYPDLSNNPFIEALQLRNKISKLFFFLGLLLLSLNFYGQNNAEIPTPLTTDNFGNGLSVSKSTFTSGLGLCIGCNISNEANLINTNLTDYATASFGALNVGFNHSLRVTDANKTFAAGTFAGFKIGPSGGLLSLELLNGVTIRTYNDGVLRETFSGASLLSLNLLSSPTEYIVGFNTILTFDAIEIVLNGGVSLLGSTNVYHAVVREYSAGPALVCNTATKLSLPTHPVGISHLNTGVTGVNLVGSGVSNVENVINSNDTDYATINFAVGLGVTGSIAVKDQVTDYPAGTYAGFEISNPSILNVSVLGNVVVSTYLNGTQVESFSGNNLLAGVALLGSNDRFKVGFVATQTFDEVKLSIAQPVAVNLGETRVYGAVLQSFCAGPALVCNTPTKLTAPNYPALVSSGFSGLVSLGNVSNVENVVSANDNDYASINFTLGAAATGTVAVKEQLTDYPAGTYAGFEISNPGILNVSVLGNVVVSTYLNGTPVESFSGNSLLAGASLLGTNSRFKVGFVASQSFDEVRLSINQTVGLSLGETRVYGAVLQSFCAGPALVCNTPTKMTAPNYPVFINSANSGFSGLVSVGNVSNIENVISADDNDYASINFLLSAVATGSVAVKDQLVDYPAGTYAGFEISNPGLLNVSVLGNVVVSTYLNGVPVESFSGNNLLAGVSLLGTNNRFKVGFVATQPFDEVKLSIAQPVGLNLGETRVYGAVFQNFCAGPTLVCNTPTKMNSPVYPVFIDNAKSGFEGLVSVGSVSNIENVISANDSDYASINFLVSAAARGSIAVKDQVTDYPVGTYAGFEIENNSLLGISALGNVTITTYLNGAQTETFSGTNLVANVSLLPSAGRFKLGFVSSQAFDEVRLTVNQTVGLSLGETRVYGAVFQSFCAGPELVCNTQTPMTAPTYPVYVNNINSGFNGVACVLCDIVDQDNLVDADLTNYAQVNLAVGALATGSLSVKNQITNYPAGTFAGYTIENPALLTVDALNSVVVATYLDGVLQETKTGNGPLVGIGTDLLVGTGKQTLGFVATKAFDEVKISFQNTVGVNLGIVKVYNAVFQKLCDPIVECNKNYVWSNPDFPVVIDTDHTGIEGVACVSCAVKDTDNLLTASQTDFANITLIAGVVGSGSVAVKDARFTYPKGTFAGYVIRNLSTLAQVNLLQSLTITTYNNGVLQESRTAGNLVDLSLLGINVLGSTPGVYNVGFKANTDFDEIRLTLNSVASVINSIDIYGAFVNTFESDGGTGSGLECNSSAVALEKDGVYEDANSDGIVNVGDRINYTFNVKNTGFETLTNLTVTDNNATVTGTPITSLAAGANNNTNYTATYNITQADIDAGVVYNLATVNATTILGVNISATSTDPTPCTTCPVSPTCADCTATSLPQTNAIALVKKASFTTPVVLGSVITYTFEVTNTGNTTLTNVVVTDPMPGLTLTGSSIATLAPGATNASIKGTYIVTQANVNAGNVTNSALVTAKDPKNNDVTDISGTTLTTDDNTVVPVDQRNTIALVKTGSVSGAGGVGDIITYTFAVTNTGTTTLTNVVVTDPMTGLTITGNPIASLAPGATDIASIKGTYTITQVDVDAGNVTNSALVTAQNPQGNNVIDKSGTTLATDDDTVTPVGQRSTIALVKKGIALGAGGLGDTIDYTFEVTNTGTTTLTNVTVTDPMTGLTITGNPIATLTPGATDNTSIKGTYIITQADVDAGKVTNSALVTATPPLGSNITDISGTTIATNDATETPVTQSPSITLVKTANTAAVRNLGDVITYTFSVRNTGNTTLNNIVVSDPMVGLMITGNPIASLAPGVTNNTSIIGTYTITQADIDAGKVTNSALVIAKDPKNNNVTDTSGTTETTNDPTETPVTQSSSIALVKTGVYNGDATKAKVGDTVTYTFTVTNTGTTTLKNVVITDPMIGSGITGSPIAVLGVGVSNATIKGVYTITQSDIDAGVVTNTAIALGQDPQGVNVQDISGTAINNDDNTTTTVPKSASLAFVKTGVYQGDATKAKVGDKITYTFSVTNTGNVTVSNIVINDAKLATANLALVPSSLAPLATGTITQDYIITQADIDLGKVTNTAVAIGQDPQGVNVQDTSGTDVDNDTATETMLPKSASLALVKTGIYNGDATRAKVGDKITYTFTVTNTGNVTVSNIVINDPKLEVVNLSLVPGTLSPLATETIIQEYIITQSDIDAGKVTNTAIVTGQDPQGINIQDTSGTSVDNDTATETTLPKSASLAFVKTGVYNGDASKAKVGDKITYTFSVTNTGNATVSNIVINDAKLGVTNLALVPSALAPAAVGVITSEYTITQSDIDAGVVTNTAIALGQDPQGVNVQDVSGTAVDNDTNTTTTVPKSASLGFVKTGVYNGDASKAKVGDKITYTFSVTNTGNATVSNIVINDAKLGVTNLALVPSALAPLATGTITQDYTITQSDIDAGVVTNTAIALGQDPQGVNVQDISGTAVDNDTNTTTTVPKSASLGFVKTGVYNGDASKAKVGDKITYTFSVTNTGNATVSNIVINDAKLGVTNLALVPSALAPAAVGVITSEYTITQSDIDAGVVTNTAIALGQDPQGVNVQDISGTAVDNDTNTTTTVPKSASLGFVKTGVYNGDASKAKVGDKIIYTFSVTNTGNATVSNIVINDAKLGTTNLALVPSTLAPLGVGVATQEYTITQADIDSGKVTNTAIAIGKDPQGVDVQDRSGTAVDNDTATETTLPKSGSLAFVKTGVYNGDATKAKVGDKITYTFTVTNTGNVTVTNIVINDAKLATTNLALAPSTLAPLATGTITQDYTITQADIDSGKVTNTAITIGQDPQGGNVQDRSGTAVDNDTATETTLPKSGSLAFVKTGVYNGDATKAKVGDKITYTFTVTNTGNVTVSNIVINDPKLGTTNVPLVPSILAPLATGVITQEYTITQTDIDIKRVTNTAIAIGKDPQGVDVQDRSGTAVDNDEPTITDLPENAVIGLILKGEFQDENNDGQAQIGETIKYKYSIKNMGEVTLSDVWIEDEMVGHGMDEGSISIASGATDDTTFSSTYTITQEDIIAGSVTNQAKVFGTSPLGKVVQDLSHDTSFLEDGSTVVSVDGCLITVFNAVSPGVGSDLEQILYVRGIDCYPDNTVQIFDRWGVKVFDVKGYDNNTKAFRGISDGRATLGKSNGLPSGTYFYIINYVDKDGNGNNKSGYLHLIND